MYIAQKEIDMINNKYTFLDREALIELIKDQFRLYMYGVRKNEIRKNGFTYECLKDCARLKKEYNFDNEEIFVRLMCQFEALFKKTFPHLFLVQNT